MPALPKNIFSERMYRESHDPNYIIVKGNPLVQDSHYTMPLADQKVLASLIRSIKPKQNSLTVKFSTHKFIQMLGLRNSGDNFYNVMHSLRHISTDNFWIRRSNGTYDLWQWLDEVHADPHGYGNFTVKFRPQLKQYLFNQSMRYRTIYKFSDIMLMQSKYSPRLYEIFRSNQSRQKIQKRGLNYSIKELKYSLNLMKRKRNGKIICDKNGNPKFKYPRFANFNSKVLKPAEHEMNIFTEYNVKMKRVKHGRKTVAINVVMSRKNKQQRQKRDDLIYCITHHIPKSEWKTWREDKISGNFHKVHNYFKKHQHQTVNGDFHLLNKLSTPKHNHKIKLFNPNTHKYVWVNTDAISDESSRHKNKKVKQESSSNLTAKEIEQRYSKLPKEEDDYVKIYNPIVGDYVWTTKKMAISIIKNYHNYNN